MQMKVLGIMCGFRHNRSTTDQTVMHSSDTGEKVGVQ
jgi:hypothetical protein